MAVGACVGGDENGVRGGDGGGGATTSGTTAVPTSIVGEADSTATPRLADIVLAGWATRAFAAAATLFTVAALSLPPPPGLPPPGLLGVGVA